MYAPHSIHSNFFMYPEFIQGNQVFKNPNVRLALNYVLFSVGCTICVGLVLAIPISMIAMGKYGVSNKYTLQISQIDVVKT